MTISFNNNGSVGSCNNSGIRKLQINSAGNLICTYSDNTIEDLGHVVGHDGLNGTNFYPNEIGFEVPDGAFNQDKDIGWSYLSLANGTSILYFKTSAPGVDPATWNKVEFGKGDKGNSGRPFNIDSEGTVKPTTGLFEGYTFLDTSDGSIYIYSASTATWSVPHQWVGPEGKKGVFTIDSRGDDFPDIDNLDYGYCFYNTEDGKLYYVEDNPANPGQKQWGVGIPFRGPKGESIKGDKGDTGASGDGIYIIYNEIDIQYTNTVLVIGTAPAGYVVTNIQVDLLEAYSDNVNDMRVRFGGTAQSEIDGTVIAPEDYFDIKRVNKYIVTEVNHAPSNKEEIISCVFNESVNNSSTGKMTIRVELGAQLPVQPISDNI